MFNDEELRIISIMINKVDPTNLFQITQEIQRKIEIHFSEKMGDEKHAESAE